MNTRLQVELLLKKKLAPILSEQAIKDLAAELSQQGVEGFSNTETLNQYRIYFIDMKNWRQGSELVNADNDVTAWREFANQYPSRVILGIGQTN